MPILEPELLVQGYVIDRFALPDGLLEAVLEARWLEVDRAIGRLVQPDAPLFRHLQRYHTFSHIEHILSIRDSADSDEEDGIWHDDGSRFIAFTLSLTPEPEQLIGGRLGIRRKGADGFPLLATPPFGAMFVYLTGHYGFEHRIHRVTRGRRVVIAGWCSGGG